jgi:hypothetical protein
MRALTVTAIAVATLLLAGCDGAEPAATGEVPGCQVGTVCRPTVGEGGNVGTPAPTGAPNCRIGEVCRASGSGGNVGVRQ